MEKRKLELNDKNTEVKDKNTYTFVIPNSDIKEINIKVPKEKKSK